MAEGEGGVAIPAGIIPWQGELGSMLDGKNACEWASAEERHQSLGSVAGIGGIGESQVAGGRAQALDEPEGIGSMHPDGVPNAKRLDVGPQGGERAGRKLHEINRLRAARESFEPECTAPCVEVGDSRTGKRWGDDAHPGLAHSISRGPDARVLRNDEPSASKPSRDYAHGFLLWEPWSNGRVAGWRGLGLARLGQPPPPRPALKRELPETGPARRVALAAC